MAEAEERALVCLEARSWLRTPYHHRARIKGVGVDCAQLPIAVYSDLGLIPPVDPEYVQDWHLHRSEEKYLGWVQGMGTREIAREDVQPGDFGIWKFGRTFSHGAIIVERPFVVHSYIGVGVSLDDMDQHEELLTREARFFTLWG
jgi:cell wall-associated NlpC family hydrolase